MWPSQNIWTLQKFTTLCAVSHTIGPVLSESKKGSVVDWPRDTTTIIVTNVNLLHFCMKLSHYSFWPSFLLIAGAHRECNNVLFMSLLYDTFVRYCGMMSRYFGMKIYYDFSHFSVKFILRQIQDLEKVARYYKKKNPQQFVLFNWVSRKKKVNKLSWHHPKITYENIVQKGHEQVFFYKQTKIHKTEANESQL